jgi:nickel transport system ATP-binding protein
MTVLRRADLRVERGECVALVGPSGSGKSTLGRILLGLETPDAGTVLFEGLPLLGERGKVAPHMRHAL